MAQEFPLPARQARQMSKICDAADFFNPEYIDVVKNQFLDTPLMNRKQWEFGMIFLALKNANMLKNDRHGLSMGSGKEVVLYAIAKQVGHLVVTDLYSKESLWECSKAANPDEYIRRNKPFPVDDGKISAEIMDMRHLGFQDCCFDFAYSSCAVEHIGTHEDFLQHLNEVYRVLKDGGIYVMTTEFTCEEEALPVPDNYVFSAKELDRLVAASKFVPEYQFDARITEQSANFPMPGRVDDLSYRGDVDFGQTLRAACVIPHVQLLWGKHHVTSCILILKKNRSHQDRQQIQFNGLLESRAFIQSCVTRYRDMIRTELSLHPFSFIANRASSYFIPHRGNLKQNNVANTIFHTDYYWLGPGVRQILVQMEREEEEQESCAIELRVHRIKASMYGDADIACRDSFTISSSSHIHKEMKIDACDDYAYAVVGMMQKGSAKFSDIQIRVLPAKENGTASDSSGSVRPSGQRLSGNAEGAATCFTSGWIKRICSRKRNRVAVRT